MIGVLRCDDLGQQARARPPLVDRRGRPLGRHHRALARPAGVGEAHVLGDEQRRRLIVELLAHLLADLDQARPAGRTRAARLRQRMLHAAARQQRGQRRAPMARARRGGSRRRRGRDCRGRGDRLLRLDPAGELEQQLRGIEMLGATAVEIAAEQRELMRELVDELLFVAELAEQLRAILPEIVGVCRKRVGRRRHHGYRCAARGDRFSPRAPRTIFLAGLTPVRRFGARGSAAGG